MNFLFCELFAKFGCVLWINLVVCYVEIANTVVLIESVLCLSAPALLLRGWYIHSIYRG